MMRRFSVFACLLAVFGGVALCASPAAAQLDLSVGVGGGDVGGGAGSVDISVGGPTSETPTATPEAMKRSEAAARELDQNVALEAVQSGRALPLAEIMALARRETAGDIVDARLISAAGFLLYELTVVGPSGDVSELYFYARSGDRVRAN